MTEQWERCAAYSESGGITKTMTTISLAVACAEEHPDEDVIVADCDPRGATTKLTGAEPVGPGLHIGAILGNDDVEGWADELAVPLDPAAGWPRNLRVIPSQRKVSNQEKNPDDHADVRLLRSLQGVRAHTFFDAPNRQGGLIIQNILTAARKVVYAAKPNEDGLDGVDGAKETVAKFRAHRASLGMPDHLREVGIILGAAWRGAVWTRDALRAVEEFENTSPGMLLRPFVPERVIVLESRAAGVWYGQYESGKPVYEAYREIYNTKVRTT
ncbi:ParA family protein [Kitasatospora aureofaciens]|uniref:ParA family protein n=1 Tax=Kitasatospora aureofaciens TaxID=1894 RepID=UPI00340466CB